MAGLAATSEIRGIAVCAFRDCTITIRRKAEKSEGGAQCKLTVLWRGVTCKFLGKWEGMGWGN